jgi:hypothetical protein
MTLGLRRWVYGAGSMTLSYDDAIVGWAVVYAAALTFKRHACSSGSV